MTARILVVDDIEANVKLLEGRLIAEYFDVCTAKNGFEALDICRTQAVDIVLLDIMMPGMDGFEVCETLKADPKTAHIPVVMVTALDQPSDRVRGLKAGADDFLTKPVNDVQLVARVKSLARLKTMADELRVRAEAAIASSGEEQLASHTDIERQALVLLVDPRQSSRERIERALRPLGGLVCVSEANAALLECSIKDFDLAIINSGGEGADPLRLISQLRANERTRFLPLVVATEMGDDKTVVQALELGVNDYIVRPLDPNELLARCLTQVKRKRYHERLRKGLQDVVDLAIIDPLTGLNNRRYLDNHLKLVFDRAKTRAKPLSLCMIDIDRFKQINDTYGHEAGDRILQDVANCLRSTVRGADLLCRFGGEEFVIIMPDTDGEMAAKASERLRQKIAEYQYVLPQSDIQIDVTASIGFSVTSEAYSTAQNLLNAADAALYEAKTCGRNRVVRAAA